MDRLYWIEMAPTAAQRSSYQAERHGWDAAVELDGEFFVALQDPEVGVLDDDDNESSGVAGHELDGLLVTMIRPLACAPVGADPSQPSSSPPEN